PGRMRSPSSPTRSRSDDTTTRVRSTLSSISSPESISSLGAKPARPGSSPTSPLPPVLHRWARPSPQAEDERRLDRAVPPSRIPLGSGKAVRKTHRRAQPRPGNRVPEGPARLAKSLLEARVVAYGREVVVPLRLLAEPRQQLDGPP